MHGDSRFSHILYSEASCAPILCTCGRESTLLELVKIVNTEKPDTYPICETTIECDAVPLEDQPVESRAGSMYPRVAKWALIGFLLVFFLKIVGALILVALVVTKFPRFFLTAIAAVPMLKKFAAYMADDDEPRPPKRES